jgi:hypothetical protein
MCVFKYHAFIYFLRPPPWYGTLAYVGDYDPYEVRIKVYEGIRWPLDIPLFDFRKICTSIKQKKNCSNILAQVFFPWIQGIKHAEDFLQFDNVNGQFIRITGHLNILQLTLKRQAPDQYFMYDRQKIKTFMLHSFWD